MILHVFRRRYDIRSGLQRWVMAALAIEAARIATETVDVGPSGVVGYPSGLRVERVLFVYVVILFVSGEGHTDREIKRDKSAHINTLQECIAGRA